MDRLLDGIARVLQTRHEPDSAWRKWTKRLRYLGDVVSAAYLVPLILIILILDFGGEGLWLAEPFRFLPAHGWLLPVPVTLLFSLVCRRWVALALNFLAIPLVLWSFMDGRVSGKPIDAPDSLRIVSNNRGQSNQQSIQGFLDHVDPHVIAFQDSGGRGPAYARRFPEKNVRAVGEFVLISAYPISDSGEVKVGDSMPAAWFDIDWDGDLIRIYSVHTPTPRDFLLQFRGFGVVKAFLRPILRPKSDELGPYVRNRYRLFRGLADELQKSPHPAIVCGDFNMPPFGRAYRDFAGYLTDGHKDAGSGWGMTFPGKTSSLFTGGEPWLRLDYVWVGEGLAFSGFETERERQSQHRAVAAAIRKRR